ncbi:unnamed protein product [Symbiodinium microadriaticum]|nr:unnamed protein product [Symbiodinium microadriaticum]
MERVASSEDREALDEERAQLAQERDALMHQLSSVTGEMSLLMGERCALEQEKAQLQAEREDVNASKTLIEQKLEATQRERANEREAFNAERIAFAADRDAFMTERNHLEMEIDSLRKERQYWQSKCMETAEGSRNTEELLVASINSICRRLHNLANEARHCRLMEEGGGRLVSYPAVNVGELDQSMDRMHVGSVETGIEDAEVILSDLENEFIPIISRFHSQAASRVDGSPKDTRPCTTPKISLSSFKENDLALFFPTPRGDYLAFNAGAPHHYLSAESKALIGHDKHFRKIYVMGKIVLKEEKIATADDSPYRLAPGVKYYEVSVTSVTSQLQLGSGASTAVEG